MNDKQHGFTLIELLIVVAIIAISAAIATPFFSGYFKNAKLRADVQNIYSQLQKAKMIAIKEQNNTSIFFDDSTMPQSFEIQSSTGAILSNSALSVSSSYGQGVATKDATNAGGTSFGGNGISFNSDKVTFDNRGLANPGYIYINNQEGKVYSVGVRFTGMIVIRKWNGTDWE